MHRTLSFDIAAMAGGQVIELQGDALLAARIPFLRLGVAFGVKAHDILETMEGAVMQEHAPGRHIAQRWRAEHAAVLFFLL